MARIGVLGNCDTGGVTYSLRALLPDSEVIPLTPPGNAAEKAAWFADLPNKAELLLVNNSVYKGSVRPLLEPHVAQIKRYPNSTFGAFHPDCCYVGMKPGNALISPAYNSAICVAGFIHRLTQRQVLNLFCDEVFDKIGYYRMWDTSVKAMQKEHSECSMDFRPYYLKVKRLGAFMHSMNHPKIDAVIVMAKFLALELGASASMLDMPVSVADGLAGLDWPLYPEIGEFYGLRGGYAWKFEGRVLGLEEFIARSFARYTVLELTAENVFFSNPGFHKLFATVLSERGIGDV
jgi:hypothetical protein